MCGCLDPARENATERIDTLLSAMNAATSSGAEIGGGPALTGGSEPSFRVAVLLRGLAFRQGFATGSSTWRRADTVSEATASSQDRCSASVARQLVEPFEAQGAAVDVFLAVYERRSALLRRLIAPYARRVVSVTALELPPSRLGSSQMASVVLLLQSVLRHAAAAAAPAGQPYYYAAAVMTRFDLHLKTPLAPLFDARMLGGGVRFLWHERRGEWRLVWHGPAAGTREYARASDATRVAWKRTTERMIRGRSSAYAPGWQQGWARARMPDAVHVLGGAAVGCYASALRYEMTRLWRANESFERHRSKVQHTQHLVAQHLHKALDVPTETGRASAAAAEAAACEPRNANGSSSCALGLLWPHGAYEASPCNSVRPCFWPVGRARRAPSARGALTPPSPKHRTHTFGVCEASPPRPNALLRCARSTHSTTSCRAWTGS